MTITARDPAKASGFPRAGLDDVRAWAEKHMLFNEPNFRVFAPDGRVQLQRWFIVPRNEEMNVYLHRFLLSDEDQALHDRLGDNRSWILSGEYNEVTNDGVFLRREGESIYRTAETPHRVELIDDRPVVTLFEIGPIRRPDWGFHCPNGWRHWEEFNRVTADRNHATKRGCG